MNGFSGVTQTVENALGGPFDRFRPSRRSSRRMVIGGSDPGSEEPTSSTTSGATVALLRSER
ncbi:MAG: hypothetical protein WCA77_03760 [Thermoplasmata archaeon]